MLMFKLFKMVLAGFSAFAMLLAFTACAAVNEPRSVELSDKSVSLTAHLTANTVSGKDADKEFTDSQLEFAVELFKKVNAETGENVLVSPASVMLALAMTANGADNETLSQMENVLGMPIDELNKYLYQIYIAGKKDDEVLKIADSIWIRDSDEFTAYDEFLQTDKDYYDAEIYKAPFDQSTVDDINAWCSQHTDGMIEKILEKLYDDEIMHLINAVCFNGEWADAYEDRDIRDDKFTDESGKETTVKLMYSNEDLYLSGVDCSGFKKSYNGGYSFVAMLPDENIDLDEFVNSLTADKISAFLNSAIPANVYAAIPEFDYDFDLQLNDALISMGMAQAFDSDHADFTKLGECKRGENIYIGFVNHFTHIEVSREGTKAAAVTDVGIVRNTSFNPEAKPHREVILNRPFVYMIIDDSTNLPVFIGTLTNIN